MTPIDELLTMLEAIEFCAGYFEPHCPVCWGRRGGGHSDNCKLGNLIKKVREEANHGTPETS